MAGKEPSPDLNLSAPAAELIALLAGPDFLLGDEDAAGLRDRAAAAVLSDPEFSHSLSEALLRAAERAGSALSPVGWAHVWRCRAEACLFSGQLSSSRKAYEQACNRAENAKAGGLLGQILVGRVHLLSLLGENNLAEKYTALSAKLLAAAGDTVYLAKLHMNRGNAHYQRSEFAPAMAHYERASASFTKLGIRDVTWLALRVNQGIACTNLLETDRARRLFREVEQEALSQDASALLAQARANRAYLEAQCGNYREALALLETAERVFAELELTELSAAALNSGARIHMDLGLAEEAAKLAADSIKAFEKAGVPLYAAGNRLTLSRALISLGRGEEARKQLSMALDYFRRKRLRGRAAETRLAFARLDLKMGKPGAAAREVRLALRSLGALELAGPSAEARRLLAVSLLAQGRAREAERELEPVLKDAGRLSAGGRERVFGLAGRIARALGDRRRAGRWLRRAAEELEIQRALVPGVEMRASIFEKQVAVYRDLIAYRLDGPKPRYDTLFALVESARARGFRERVGGRSARLLAERRTKLGLLTRSLEDAELADSGVEILEPIHREIQKLERQVRRELKDGDGTSGGRVRWRPVDPDKLQGKLRHEEILLHFFAVEDRILVLAMDRKRKSVRLLPVSVADLYRQLERVRFQFETVALLAGQASESARCFPPEASITVLRNLYDMLLAPLADLLPARGLLTIVPHDLLHQVPFECLHDERGWIDRRYRISRAPTADFLLRRSRRRGKTTDVDLLCGTVAGGPAFAAKEVEALAELLPKANTRILIDADSDTLLAALPGARRFHLSTHGVFRADNPFFSRLSTRDGALFLADILALDLKMDLAVLSACESGKVLPRGGDDLAGVAHAFLAAGARHLLASRWRIHDEATLDLMLTFYRHHEAGEEPSAALAAAMSETRERWPHPFHWGGFSVFGA